MVDTVSLNNMATLSDKYAKLFQDFSHVDEKMRSAPEDGLQRELQGCARRIVTFEHEHRLPRLKLLVADHGSAVSAIEVARQKLTRLERSIVSQASYIENRFAEHDVTGDSFDLLAWELSARLGAQAVAKLTERALELEDELHAFVKSHPGASDCIQVEQKLGWDKTTRESFSWLDREAVQTLAASVAAEEVAA